MDEITGDRIFQNMGALDIISNLLDEATAAKEAAKLAKFRAIDTQPGADPKRGEPMFKALCLTCHDGTIALGEMLRPPRGRGNSNSSYLKATFLTPSKLVKKVSKKVLTKITRFDILRWCPLEGSDLSGHNRTLKTT